MTNKTSNVEDEFGNELCLKDHIIKTVLFGTNKDITKWFLNSILKVLGITVNTIEYLNTEIPKDYKDSKTQILDIVLLVNGKYIIDIEANSHYYNHLHLRNLTYAMTLLRRYVVDDRKYDMEVILLDLTRGLRKTYSDINTIFYLQSNNQEKYIQNYENLTVDIDKAQDIWYSKNNLISEYFFIAMLVMNADEILELSKLPCISIEDKEKLLKVREELLKVTKEEKDARLWQDRKDIFDAFVDWEKQDSYKEGMQAGEEKGLSEGIIKGTESTKIDNALRMLKNNIPIDLIEKCTLLPLAKIKEIQDSLVTS